MPRHQHTDAYAAVVLGGGYIESGIRGRFRVGPGDVLMHAALDTHLNGFCGRRTEIFNLFVERPRSGCWSGRVADPDALVRLAEVDSTAASIELRAQLAAGPDGLADWPDLLAARLRENSAQRLDDWAENMGLARETLSRGFKKIYGVTPAAYRAEARARRALDLIEQGGLGLAGVAATVGFADQSHMTRAIKALTGAAPSAWIRTSNPFKTGLQ